MWPASRSDGLNWLAHTLAELQEDRGCGAGPMPLHAGVSTPMIKILTAILSVIVVLALGACLTVVTLPFRAVRGLVRSRAVPA